jgi:putative transposase
MVTSATWSRRDLSRRDRWARLFIDTLYHYRGSAYFLHESVVMPDHIPILLAPKTSLEKALQLIKGGFSYRAKKELGSSREVGQKGFSDRRIRDGGDYLLHVSSFHENPVGKHLCERAEEFAYSSAHAGFELDPVPQGLKPAFLSSSDGAPEGVPFQIKRPSGTADTAPFQGRPAASDKSPTLARTKTRSHNAKTH